MEGQIRLCYNLFALYCSICANIDWSHIGSPELYDEAVHNENNKADGTDTQILQTEVE